MKPRSLSLFATRLFPRVRDGITLPSPNLRLLFVNNMLNKDFARMLRLELADPPRIPEFTGDAEILAAAHESVGSAAFCCGGDSVG